MIASYIVAAKLVNRAKQEYVNRIRCVMKTRQVAGSAPPLRA